MVYLAAIRSYNVDQAAINVVFPGHCYWGNIMEHQDARCRTSKKTMTNFLAQNGNCSSKIVLSHCHTKDGGRKESWDKEWEIGDVFSVAEYR